LSAAGKKNQAMAEQSLERLCRIYWPPLYAYIRRQGESPQGRFRSFLLASLKHFLSNQRDRARAQKRGGGQTPLPLDFSDAESRAGFQPADHQTPERAYEKRWALTLLDQSLGRLQREYSDHGKEEIFEQLKTTLTEGRGGVAYAELAGRLCMSEAAVKMAVHRLRRRYREVLREEISETVATASEVEDELRDVFRALSY
jgi:RNA polymerase sigma-70 factor (ECF subfamily)